MNFAANPKFCVDVLALTGDGNTKITFTENCGVGGDGSKAILIEWHEGSQPWFFELRISLYKLKHVSEAELIDEIIGELSKLQRNKSTRSPVKSNLPAQP